MKQSIRPTRATLNFPAHGITWPKFCQKEPRLKECSKNGKDMVKLTLHVTCRLLQQAVMVRQYMGFNEKEVALWWVVFVQIQTARKRSYVSTSIKKIGNVAHYVIFLLLVERSRISPYLKKQIWIHSLHAINIYGLFTAYFSQHEKRMQSRLRWCVLFNCVTDQMTDRTSLNGPWLLQCINLMSACATPKSVLIGKHHQHEADLLSKGRLSKGDSRIVSTQQTCHDEPNMTRFCKRFSTRSC